MKIKDFNQLLTEVDSCTICETNLKAGVRPVLQVNPHAKILIAGQAPGSRVHATGIPFDDPSGDRLREWMGINKETFYDSQKIAILPMAFCYPGKGKSGDLPPPPICAETWRNKLLETMPHIQLTLVIGQYALAWHLKNRGTNLTETVKNWAMFGDQVMPLPHPSPRNNIWLKNNPWFEADVLTVLQNRVHNILK
ncbi:uracil-DNA glycosylase family protein [Psychromonas sp. 14N.309.X.WAT.B.A12]|uniref:uracil-DNA glycosylase family protein n=1 Tax=Psychromonas sp. 14N.309.X.WAT.B.A12 TaxID=2998322 RepID=UPI0025B13E42|nr:uracil-DNA glycosylase family protein [Psychromonas sp. 14N.309.X.WAT.B.A12]MDN2661877.1 uracil-DNA glycosylase family protein [Psychromonas sp. 14N.309.X.WAT.B.A12]